MILAEFGTSHFTFQALGNDREHALNLLRKAWREHAESTGADHDFLDEYVDDVNYSELDVGTALRDGSTIYVEPSGS